MGGFKSPDILFAHNKCHFHAGMNTFIMLQLRALSVMRNNDLPFKEVAQLHLNIVIDSTLHQTCIKVSNLSELYSIMRLLQ